MCRPPPPREPPPPPVLAWEILEPLVSQMMWDRDTDRQHREPPPTLASEIPELPHRTRVLLWEVGRHTDSSSEEEPTLVQETWEDHCPRMIS